MRTKENLGALAKILFGHGGPKSEEGDYACLADEADEQGAVIICDKYGHFKMSMPRHVWDALQATNAAV